MAFPTFALGCLPTFEQTSWLAPILLIVLRLIQGLSVGGQLMSSVVFTLERSGNNDTSNWGIWGSSVFAAATVGTVIGSMLSYILRETLTEEQLLSYGWRIPFLFGALGILPGSYLKYKALDHPADTTAASTDTATSEDGSTLKRSDTLTETFGTANRRSLIASALVPCLPAATYYITFVWLAIFMETIANPPIPRKLFYSNGNQSYLRRFLSVSTSPL